MRTCILASCLWLSLLAAVLAQDGASPPDQARLVGRPAEITFRWTGSAPSYFLEVFYLNGATVFEGEVKATTKTLPVQTGPGYRWRVSVYKGGAYTPLVPLRNFQVLAPESFHFDGQAGAAGRPGDYGQSGEPGGPGGAGRQVTVQLEPMGDVIQVTIDAAGRPFLLLPSSGPIEVTARGGPGGTGGPGGQGVAGDYYLQYPNSNDTRRRYVVTPPGPGGDGGPGGPGGAGGVVTLKAPDRALLRYVTVDARGGPGGRGGRPGPPGALPTVPYGYGYPVPSGQPGRPGASGPAGPDGQVVPLAP